jgi:hypothetical protein
MRTLRIVNGMSQYLTTPTVRIRRLPIIANGWKLVFVQWCQIALATSTTDGTSHQLIEAASGSRGVQDIVVTDQQAFVVNTWEPMIITTRLQTATASQWQAVCSLPLMVVIYLQLKTTPLSWLETLHGKHPTMT